MKQDVGADFIMTQLCQHVEHYEWWVEAIRKAGVYLPIDVGVMPVLQKDQSAWRWWTAALSRAIWITLRYGNNPKTLKGR